MDSDNIEDGSNHHSENVFQPNKELPVGADLVARSDHHLSRRFINPNAIKVLYRLEKAGFEAYLVGGSVRDLLIGKTPKDFDVATNAHPQKVRRLFSNCRLIGRRFRLAHVFYDNDIIEVATFRAHHDQATAANQGHMQNGQILRDNVYGTIEQDAERRDFSINALYYNFTHRTITDFGGGIDDINNKVIRILGDPMTRYREDPIRLLRAIRFALKADFTIEPETEKPLFSSGELLQNVPDARLFDEMCKLLLSTFSVKAFEKLEYYCLLPYLFPALDRELTEKPDSQDYKDYRPFIQQVLLDTQTRLQADKSVTPAFLLAAFLWPSLQRNVLLFKDDYSIAAAFDKAIVLTLESNNLTTFAIQKNFELSIGDIWRLQYLLTKRNNNAKQMLSRNRFRAGYDFLLLRSKTLDPELTELATWWTEFQTVDSDTQEKMINVLPQPKRRKRKKRKK